MIITVMKTMTHITVIKTINSQHICFQKSYLSS